MITGLNNLKLFLQPQELRGVESDALRNQEGDGFDDGELGEDSEEMEDDATDDDEKPEE